MLSLRPDLPRTLSGAVAASTDAGPDWLRVPPVGTEELRRSTRLPATADLSRCGAALLTFDVHRRSGLRVAASGTASPGSTVVVAKRLGPVWAVAPCRVLEVVEHTRRVGFTYATLPGHPEHGVEEFAFVADDDGLRFEVRAVSCPAFWGSRLLPGIARRIQVSATERYLDAATEVATTAV